MIQRRNLFLATAMSNENRNTPNPRGIAASSGNGQANDVAAEDAETREILYILYSKPERLEGRDTKGSGKWFWIALPVAFIFGHYTGLNLSHKFLFFSRCMAVMFAVRGYELLIGFLVKRGWLSLRAWPTRLVLYDKHLIGFIFGFVTWGTAFIAFFNHQH